MGKAKTRAKTQLPAKLKPVDTWDYKDVPAVDARRCKGAAEKISTFQRRMAGDVIAIGMELLAVKDRLLHGQFTQWVKHHFEWSDRTARSMMAAAEVFGKTEAASVLNIDPTALYLLSSDSCPDEVRQEILAETGPGNWITPSLVKDRIRKFGGDDDEDETPAPASNGKQRRAADSPAAIDTEAVDLYDAEPAEWSLSAFIYSVRREVNQWVAVCPDDEREEIAQVLRDLAAQVEGEEPSSLE